MSLIIFLGILFILVLVHELGHFAVAKWTGMRVDEFGIGFPPKIFGIKRGETEYTLNLLPIGGFVKIYGEDSIGVEGGDRENRSFISKNKWAQTIVLVAGVTMNVLLAWVLITSAFAIGVQSSVTEAEATDNAALTITSVLPGSPAEKAQIKPGSIIKKVTTNDETLSHLTPSGFSTFIAAHASTPITVAYTYNSELRVVQIESVSGLITDDAARPAIGVGLAQIEVVKRPFFTALYDGVGYTLRSLKDIVVGLGGLFYDSIRLKADFSHVAGPIGIVGLVGEASTHGVTALLMFTAFISLNLAVINILPFPALDGGRLLFVAIEAVRGKPINPKYVAALNATGFLILIILMIAVTWNDIARIL